MLPGEKRGQCDRRQGDGSKEYKLRGSGTEELFIYDLLLQDSEDPPVALRGILMEAVLDACRDGKVGDISLELDGPLVSERGFWREAFITNW